MGKNTVNAKTWLDNEFSDTATKKSTIKDWYAKLRRGKKSIKDGDRSGRPKKIVTDENIQ